VFWLVARFGPVYAADYDEMRWSPDGHCIVITSSIIDPLLEQATCMLITYRIRTVQYSWWSYIK
jgi:hypothetical protein